jgi:hypothetical protein
MGDFSRDPRARLTDSIGKHYVGVRLQQGVPVLDADWNELDDVRRSEIAELGRWTVGDGVPVGTDGFRILPIAGGGVNTVVLVSKATAVGESSVQIELATSTAASALGFDADNAYSERLGSRPAQLTGNRAQPFALTAGSRLTIRADGQAPQTITFASGDFANIAAATAAEVAAAIVAAVSNITASVGTGNDFIIKGGNGTAAGAGRMLVAGQLVLNDRSLKYSEQPLYRNAALAQAWGVEPVAQILTPAGNETDVAYLDVWHREVGSVEDAAMLDDRIGIETALRLRREWAVRVARHVDYPTIAANALAGHTYSVLTLLQRIGATPTIDADMIQDQRETDLSLQREITYRGPTGAVLVDSTRFSQLMKATRNTMRDFIAFLTTKFIPPDSGYLAAEVVGLEALGAIAGVAEHGIALVSTRSLGTRAALELFEQLLESEQRFLKVWQDVLLPLTKPAVGKIYQIAFTQLIARIASFVNGPAPGNFTAIATALTAGNLLEAVRSQEEINGQFGVELGRPTGSLSLLYAGSPNLLIVRNQSFDMNYEVSGSVTPDDDIGVEVFIDPAWQVTVRKADGSVPFGLHLGPGTDDGKFIVSIKAPDVAAAQTNVSLRVFAVSNPGYLDHITTQKTLKIGDPPPVSEKDFMISIKSTPLVQEGGQLRVPVSLSLADVTYLFRNNSAATTSIDFEFGPASPAQWTITPPAPADMTNRSVAAGGTVQLQFFFQKTAPVGSTLAFALNARNHATSAVLAQTTTTFVVVAG